MIFTIEKTTIKFFERDAKYIFRELIVPLKISCFSSKLLGAVHKSRNDAVGRVGGSLCQGIGLRVQREGDGRVQNYLKVHYIICV